MADSTVNYGWPYPQGGDKVAVHSDVANVAKAADATMLQTEVRVAAAETGLLSLGSRLGTAEASIQDLQAAQLTVTYLGDGVYEIA